MESISQYDVFTFDVFDTLIKRSCSSFQALWNIIEFHADKTLNMKTNFFKNRQKAEIQCSHEGISAPSLHQIYERMEYPSKIKKFLQNLELKIELQFALPNYEGKRLFSLCQKTGKEIYVVSDTYYSEDFIRGLLKKCGYHVNQIIVSCQEHCVKKTGQLFEVLMERYSLKGKRILHFGDNPVSDIRGAEKAGLYACFVRSPKYTSYLEKGRRRSQEDDILYYFVNHYLPFIEDRKTQIGFETLGAVVLGYCQWLHAMTKKYHTHEILFCARDAYLFYECYLKLYPQEKENVHYFYVSLKSLFRPYQETIKKKNCDSASQTFLLKKYIQQFTDKKELILADSGFGGHTQTMLQDILGEEYQIHGMYLRMSRNFVESNLSAEPYLFQKFPSPKARISGAFLESVIQASHGRTLCYEEKNHSVIPVMGEPKKGLELADNAKRIFCVEPDKLMIPALKRTLWDYRKKTTIIPKFAGEFSSGETISIDDYFGKHIPKDISVIKMDIEGYEQSALRGMRNTLQQNPQAVLLICAYHQPQAEKEIRNILEPLGYTVISRKGYMFFHEFDNFITPYFRHGVLEAYVK